jgi:hypothetical protein
VLAVRLQQSLRGSEVAGSARHRQDGLFVPQLVALRVVDFSLDPKDLCDVRELDEAVRSPRDPDRAALDATMSLARLGVGLGELLDATTADLVVEARLSLRCPEVATRNLANSGQVRPGS